MARQLLPQVIVWQKRLPSPPGAADWRTVRAQHTETLSTHVFCLDAPLPPPAAANQLWQAWFYGEGYFPNVASQGSRDPSFEDTR